MLTGALRSFSSDASSQVTRAQSVINNSPANSDVVELLDLPPQVAMADRIVEALSMKPTLAKIPHLKPDAPEPMSTPLSLDDQPLEGEAALQGSTDLIRHAGIYATQIHARIERVWLKPRSAVIDGEQSAVANDDVSFQCQAQIVQDEAGNVREILLPRCNGSSAWRRSLIAAIQQASPLPAPPDPAVFTHIVVLNFVGFPYSANVAAEEYEPPTAQVWDQRSQKASSH